MSSTYVDMMFVRFVAEYDRLRREAGGTVMFADLPPGLKAPLKAAFLRILDQVETDLY